jgi:hypothetical protein
MCLTKIIKKNQKKIIITKKWLIGLPLKELEKHTAT